MRFDVLMVGSYFRDRNNDLWFKIYTMTDSFGDYNAYRISDNMRAYFFGDEIVTWVH